MAKTRTSFKKGQIANPKGRPKKGYSITAWFKNMLNSRPEVREAMGKAITKKALEGDVAAQKMVWNYMDGMPQSNEVNDNRTQIVVIPPELIKKYEITQGSERGSTK